MTTRQTRTDARSPKASLRTRLAAVALGGSLAAGTLAVGASPAAADDPPKPAVTVLAYPPVAQLSTPALFSVTGAVTLPEVGSGTLTVTLHKPKADDAAACSGATHSSKQASVNVTEIPDPPVVAPATTAEVIASIKATDPEGAYQYQATYAPKGGGEVVKSTCFSVNVAHRKDTDPPKPGDPNPPSTTIQTQVTKYFRLMVDRDPTQIELAKWVGDIQAKTATLGDVVEDLRGSTEHVTIIDPVTRLYFAYFLRSPDADGLDYWIAQRRGGRSLISTSDFFSQSPEFSRRYGSLDNAAFVDLIYRNILERSPDDKGKAFWIDELAQGRRTRGDVMVGFSESPEYRREIANEVHVSVVYALLIGRAPTAIEFDAAVDLLDVVDTGNPFTISDLADDLINRRAEVR